MYSCTPLLHMLWISCAVPCTQGASASSQQYCFLNKSLDCLITEHSQSSNLIVQRNESLGHNMKRHRLVPRHATISIVCLIPTP
jgi:hypothetical protein